MARGKPTATPRAADAARARQLPSPPAVSEDLSRRVVIEHIRPEVDGGRFPIKRSVGESVEVIARIFADGHDVLVAILRDRHHEGFTSAPWRETPMTIVAQGTDEWRGSFAVDTVGWHEYEIVAWVDRFLTWRRELRAKAGAARDVGVELLEGSLIVREA